MTEPTRDYVGVAMGDLVYVIVADRAKFDKIDIPPSIHTNGCTSKFLEANGVRIIFQHWTASAGAADERREAGQ